jgi:hypothetical protein
MYICTPKDIKPTQPRSVSSIGFARNPESGKLKIYFSKDANSRMKAYQDRGYTDVVFIDLGADVEVSRNEAVLTLIASTNDAVKSIVNSPEHFQALHDFISKNGLLQEYENRINLQKLDDIVTETEELEEEEEIA